MAQTKTPEQVEEWLLALEAERLDISYRRLRKPEPVVELVKAEKARKRPPAREISETAEANLQRLQREKLFFDAGRFAGGARDPEATEAYRRFVAMTQGGKK